MASIQLTSNLANLLGDTTCEKYCYNRILSFHQVYKHDRWAETKIHKSDKVDDYQLMLKESHYDAVTQDIAAFRGLCSMEDKVRFVLDLEGYIPSNLRYNILWEIKCIYTNQITITNVNYYESISRSYDMYMDRDVPIGILNKRNNKLILMDGHCRLKKYPSNSAMFIIGEPA